MFFKGQSYLDVGNFEAAEKSFLWAIEKDSTLATNPYGMVELYWTTNRPEKGKKILKDLLEMNLTSPNEYGRISGEQIDRFPEEAIALYLKVPETVSDNPYYCNGLALAYTYMENGNYQEALKWHKRAVELAPETNLFINNEGLIYLRWNQFKAAEERFKKTASKGYNSGYGGLFMLYLQNGMIAEAEEQLRIGMEKDSTDIPNLLRIVGHRNLQHPESVPQYFKKIEELYPLNPYVNYEYAIYLTFYKKNKEAAFQELEKALKKGFRDYVKLHRHEWLLSLKTEKQRWDSLIKKYFPERDRRN